MRLRCPRCEASMEATPGRRILCPECGYAGRAPGAPHGGVPRTVLWTGLVLNVLVPGIGTLHTGRPEGWLQLVLWGVGLATIVNLVGLALVPAAWVWAVTQSVHQLQVAGASRRATA